MCSTRVRLLIMYKLSCYTSSSDKLFQGRCVLYGVQQACVKDEYVSVVRTNETALYNRLYSVAAAADKGRNLNLDLCLQTRCGKDNSERFIGSCNFVCDSNGKSTLIGRRKLFAESCCGDPKCQLCWYSRTK